VVFCPISANSITAKLSTFLEEALPHRAHASAPTLPQRQPWCALTENLAEELKGTGIDVNAVAPGAVNTRMLQEVLDAKAEQVGQAIYEDALKQKERGGTPPEKAAGLCVALLSAESDGLTGRLISAVWDPWPSLNKWKDKLAATDVYTLRRIVPDDRGIVLE
jgi:hypothetical protein